MKSSRTVWALGAAAALTGIFPYIAAMVTWPAEPLSVSVLYRHPEGDSQYFPLVRALAEGSLTEFSLKEEKGTAVRSFPIASVAIHAAAFRILGPSGFIVADVAVTVGYFVAVAWLFRAAGVSVPIAGLVAFALTVRLPMHLTAGLGGRSVELIGPVWGARFPRPFVSELFVVAVLAALTHIVSQAPAGKSPSLWVFLGSCISLVIQSDFHSAVTLIGTFGVVVSALYWAGAATVIRNAFIAGAAALVVSGTFIWQRVFESPDLPVRYGVFPVPRLHPLFAPWAGTLLASCTVVILVMAFLLTKAFRTELDRSFGTGAATAFGRRIGLLITVLLVAHLALPVSTVLLGKSIQPYQFLDRVAVFNRYSMLICMAIAVDAIYRSVGRRMAGGWVWVRIITGITVFAILAYTAKSRVDDSRFDAHLRRDTHATLSELGGRPYRAEFADLIRHLSARAGDTRPVLASFDIVVFSWWMTFTDGYSFLADPFASAVPDRVVEDRLIAFCHFIGMDVDHFIEFVSTKGGHWFWLSLGKHQASRAYAFAPIEEYPAEVQRRIREGWPLNAWSTALPSSEIARLRKAFADWTGGDDLGGRELDLIVLTNDGAMGGFSPPPGAWQVTYQSPRFRVFERKK